jgi:hypothetical protein
MNMSSRFLLTESAGLPLYSPDYEAARQQADRLT